MNPPTILNALILAAPIWAPIWALIIWSVT
jgi:hypothetical protein